MATRKDVREALSGYEMLDSDVYDMGDYVAVVTSRGVYRGSDFYHKAGLTDQDYLMSVRNRKTCERLEEGVFQSRERPEVVFIKGGHFHAFGDEWEFLKHETFLKGFHHKKRTRKRRP